MLGVGWGGGEEGGKGGDEADVEGADALGDVGGDFGGGGEGGPDHFEFGVEVVDEVEGEGLGGFGLDGSTEFEFAVVGGDEVEEVEADGFVFGGEVFPGFALVGEVVPEAVDEFESDDDVAEHFAVELDGEVEAIFGRAGFPEFAGVVEKDAGEEEIAVEFGVGLADGMGRAEHLGDVGDESAAAGMVEGAGGGGALEARGVELEKAVAKSFEAGILDRGDEFLDGGKIGGEGGLGLGRTREEGLGGGFIEVADLPVADFETEVWVEEKFAGELDGGALGQVAGEGKRGRIGPSAEGEGIAFVAELDFVIRFALTGVLALVGFDLGVETGAPGSALGG